MGLLDILKPKSPLEKASKQVLEVYAQPEYRRTAMDKLFEIGTPESYKALLMRFTINANGQIADESEKRDLVDQLVERGAEALPSIKEFIRTEKKAITFPIRALTRILSKDEAIAFLQETLQSYEPMDHRSVHAKLALVIVLGELLASEHAELFVPYLDDHSDDIQFQAVVALERLALGATKDSLIKVCQGDLHAARVKRRAAQALATLGWSVKGQYDTFDEELKAEYIVGKKGQLIAKSKPSDQE